MKQKLTRILFWKAGIVIGYFVIGIVFHHYLFPPHKPDHVSYFKTGDQFMSDWEGFEQPLFHRKMVGLIQKL